MPATKLRQRELTRGLTMEKEVSSRGPREKYFQHCKLVLLTHMKLPYDRKSKSQDYNVADKIDNSCGLVHDVNVRDAAAHLRPLRAPIVWYMVLKNRCERHADPPE